MIVAFLNLSNKTVEFYSEKGKEVVGFEEVDFLEEYAGNRDILYVTNAIETDVDNLKQLILSLDGSAASTTGFSDMDEATSGFVFLRSTKKGVLNVTDCGVILNGPDDCQIIDEELYEKLKTSYQLKQLLNDKAIEIIDEATMKKVRRAFGRERKKKDSLMKLRDQKLLDSMLLKPDVKAVDAAINMDLIGEDVMDITSDVVSAQHQRELSDDEIAERLKKGLPV